VATLQSLYEQRRELDEQIEVERAKSRDAAITHVREVMDAYGLSMSDLGGTRGKSTSQQSASVQLRNDARR
jgi:DNA-binding protein H-NS